MLVKAPGSHFYLIWNQSAIELFVVKGFGFVTVLDINKSSAHNYISGTNCSVISYTFNAGSGYRKALPVVHSQPSLDTYSSILARFFCGLARHSEPDGLEIYIGLFHIQCRTNL